RKNKKQLHQIRIQQRSKRPEVSTPPGKTTQPAQTPPLDQRPVEERSVQLALEWQEDVKAIIKHQHASDAAAGRPLTEFGRSDVDRDDFVEGLEFFEADSTLPPAAERPVPRPVAQRTTSSLSPTPPA